MNRYPEYLKEYEKRIREARGSSNSSSEQPPDLSMSVEKARKALEEKIRRLREERMWAQAESSRAVPGVTVTIPGDIHYAKDDAENTIAILARLHKVRYDPYAQGYFYVGPKKEKETHNELGEIHP